MRGKRVLLSLDGHRAGITPACAGKTFTRHGLHAIRQDHPRVCGENVIPERSFLRAGGSPPRVRGKPRCGCALGSAKRITPACAGKTCPSCQRSIPPQDHPRVCGENALVSLAYVDKVGSPPRVRGKLASLSMSYLPSRITPACAGKTFRDYLRRDRAEDHPRVCGENMQWSGEMTGAGGSPPRVRGKRIIGSKSRSPRRITPACAGKTRLR